MGKWATYQKRGSAARHGTVNAPTPSDWGAGTLAGPSRITFTRLTPAPAPALGIIAQYRVDAPGMPWVQPGFNATSITTSSNTGFVYLMRVAWAKDNNEAVSDWSAAQTITSL